MQVRAVSQLSQTVTTVSRLSGCFTTVTATPASDKPFMYLDQVSVLDVTSLCRAGSGCFTTVTDCHDCHTTVTATPASDKPFMCLDQVSVLDVTCLCRAGSGCFTTVTATPARDAATPRPSWHPWWRPS